MTTLVTVFKSTDSGAPTLSGTAGDLINVLSHCLVIGKVYRTADDASFSDNTTEARTDISGQTAFTLFPTPGTADRTYFGHSSRFTSLTFSFGTLGTSATYVWEYWNGSAWTTLSVTDGTSSFTANGTVTWTSPGGSWATTSVNSVTMYWVRVRFTGSNPATNPLVNSVTYLGWLEVQSGSSQRDYKQCAGSNNYILSVNDNAPTTAKEARVKCFETSTGLGTGINQFPLVATQGVGGNTGYVVWRKSNTADATTRAWTVIADKWTVYVFLATGDAATTYLAYWFGDFYSFATFNDPGRCLLQGRIGQDTATITNGGNNSEDLQVHGGSTLPGHYVNRDHQGGFTPLLHSKFGALEYCTVNAINSAYTLLAGSVAYKNPADSLIYLSPVWVGTSTGVNVIRGRMKGFWHWCHTAASASDGDTLTGSGELAGKTFLILKSTANSGIFCIETSDTWESNV